MRPLALAAFAVVVLAGAVPAADPVRATPAEAKRLAELVRPMLLTTLPDPLTTTERNWGTQRTFPAAVNWSRGRPHVARAPMNDGHWQRLSVTASDPDHSLTFDVTDVVSPEPGRTTFDAVLGLDVRGEHETQVWKAGARLVGTTTRARCRVTATLKCEVTTRLETRPGGVIPAAVVRVRVTAADVGYSGFVCEQVLGMHGRPAQLAGDTARGFVNAVRPDIERRLLERANAAVVKAADTKDVRVELDRLLPGHTPVGK